MRVSQSLNLWMRQKTEAEKRMTTAGAGPVGRHLRV